MSEQNSTANRPGTSRAVAIALAWAWAVVPLAYGVFELIVKVRLLFIG